MKFKSEEIEEIASRFTDSGTPIQRNLILLTGLPGSGKTTTAKEIVRQMQAVHFDIDEIKRIMVPAEEVTEGIDPPEVRFRYYSEAIRQLPEHFSKTPLHTVVMDETFHLRDFRDFWDDSARALNIRIHWIEIVCDEEILKQRLRLGKDRENHILGDKAFPMYLKFKEAYEPMIKPHEVIDTSRDIISQIQGIVERKQLA